MPPLSADEDRRIRRIEADVADLKKKHSELDHEKGALFDSIKGWVAKAMTAALEPFREDIDELKRDNKEQLGFLKEAAEERGRRKQREEDAARAVEQRKLDIETKKVDVDEVKTIVDGKVRFRTAILVLLGIIATALGSAIAASIASQPHH